MSPSEFVDAIPVLDFAIARNLLGCNLGDDLRRVGFDDITLAMYFTLNCWRLQISSDVLAAMLPPIAPKVGFILRRWLTSCRPHQAKHSDARLRHTALLLLLSLSRTRPLFIYPRPALSLNLTHDDVLRPIPRIGRCSCPRPHRSRARVSISAALSVVLRLALDAVVPPYRSCRRHLGQTNHLRTR